MRSFSFLRLSSFLRSSSFLRLSSFLRSSSFLRLSSFSRSSSIKGVFHLMWFNYRLAAPDAQTALKPMASLETSPETNSDRTTDGKNHLKGLKLPLCPKIQNFNHYLRCFLASYLLPPWPIEKGCNLKSGAKYDFFF